MLLVAWSQELSEGEMLDFELLAESGHAQQPSSSIRCSDASLCGARMTPAAV